MKVFCIENQLSRVLPHGLGSKDTLKRKPQESRSPPFLFSCSNKKGPPNVGIGLCVLKTVPSVIRAGVIKIPVGSTIIS